MATVTGFTAERMLAIENSTVVDGDVVGNNLILTTRGGTQIDAGNVRGPIGPQGIPGAVPSINDQTGAAYAPRIFANKAALDLWVTAPRGAVAVTTDNDAQWEKSANGWFLTAPPRIFATATELTNNWGNAPEGARAINVDGDVAWYKSPLGWNIDNGIRVFADATERDNRWPFPPAGSVALTIDTNTIWQRRSGIWQKPWNMPWGTQYIQKYGAVSGAFGNTAVAIPGYSVLVNTPGGRLMEIETTLSVWNTGVSSCEVVAEFRPAAGGAGIGQAATYSTVGVTTQLKISAQWSPTAMNNVQFDIYCWTNTSTVQLYAQDPARPAITTVRDHGPTP